MLRLIVIIKSRRSNPALTRTGISACLVSLLIAIFILLACDFTNYPPEPEPPTPTATSTPPTATPIPFPQYISLPSLDEVKRIYIEDDWSGEGGVAPLQVHYTLERQADDFIGVAEFSLGRYSGKEVTATEAIVIPDDVTQIFFGMLEASRLEEGEYKPPDEGGTDNYPSLKIELQLSNQSIVFYSTSVGHHPPVKYADTLDLWSCCTHEPWAVEYRGKTYVLNDIHPDQALAVLNPYLKRDVLVKLMYGPASP